MTLFHQNRLCFHHGYDLSSCNNIALKFLRLFALSLISLSLLSCSSDEPYDFDDAADAIDAYRDYLRTVRDISSSNTDGFIKELQRWKEVNDTVYRFLVNDSAFSKPHTDAVDFSLSMTPCVRRCSVSPRHGGFPTKTCSV